MIKILKSCLHKQRTQKTEVDLNFGIKVAFVKNPTTLFQTFSKNKVKMKDEKRNLILDRNHLWNHLLNTSNLTGIKFIQMTNLHLTLKSNVHVIGKIQEIAQLQEAIFSISIFSF